MVNRREFLKSAGILGVATISGYGGYRVGEYLKEAGNRGCLTIHGFLPAQKEIFNEVCKFLIDVTGGWKNFHIVQNENVPKLFDHFSDIWDNSAIRNGGNGFLDVVISKLSNSVESDIVIIDEKKRLYSPEKDFPTELLHLRDQLKGMEGVISIILNYTSEIPFMKFSSGKNRVAIIENENGVVDKIPIRENSTNIIARGPLGSTDVAISDGMVFVRSSPCNHGLCKLGRIKDEGEIIVCAPNKVIVRVETV